MYYSAVRFRYDCSSWGSEDARSACCPRRRAPGVCMRTLVVAYEHRWPTNTASLLRLLTTSALATP
jgi:hypothetical protein